MCIRDRNNPHQNKLEFSPYRNCCLQSCLRCSLRARPPMLGAVCDKATLIGQAWTARLPSTLEGGRGRLNALEMDPKSSNLLREAVPVLCFTCSLRNQAFSSSVALPSAMDPVMEEAALTSFTNFAVARPLPTDAQSSCVRQASPFGL